MLKLSTNYPILQVQYNNSVVLCNNRQGEALSRNSLSKLMKTSCDHLNRSCAADLILHFNKKDTKYLYLFFGQQNTIPHYI